MLIVGIGGTPRPLSTTETALRVALDAARATGVETLLLSGVDLLVPMYEPDQDELPPAAQSLVDTIRAADGFIIASPGYHGTISGLVKNGLDYIEVCRSDERPYLDGVPVGCIAVAYGWQAAVNTLRTLRDIVHSLRGWPTPYGAAVNAANGCLTGGECSDASVRAGLGLVGEQVAGMANRLA